MSNDTHFQAYAQGKSQHTAATPKDAAIGFFEKNPTARKCNIVSGKCDGHFFTVTYGRASEGDWPTSYKNVTKKSLGDLPS